MESDYDLCVIGGGVNGVGIARDAAGRGLSVLLVEAQDLASATSSASTKLIHGGLRYLEQYEFKLVDESLRERETLLKSAPHIIWPLDFILPHAPHLRPFWMIQSGLMLYDLLGGKKTLARSRTVDFNADPMGKPLQSSFQKGFCYQDCWVEDSRLVVLNALDAKEKGADILTRTACLGIAVHHGRRSWSVNLQDRKTGDEFSVTAKKIINAGGPWVRKILEASNLLAGSKHIPHIRLVKGSHIIVPKLYEGSHACILQQPDKRIVFAIPYEKDFTLIGTTDVEIEEDPGSVSIDQQEIEYLCAAIDRNFHQKISPADIIWSYSGVRPLMDDGQASSSSVTRDYKLYLDERFGPEILSVFGGKITTYRKLAAQAVNMITGEKTKKESWTKLAPLPGGDIKEKTFEDFIAAKKKKYKFLPDALLYRYGRAYGTRIDNILSNVSSLSEMGQHFGNDLYEKEVQYLIDHEFAYEVDDILWRRSKLGLHITPETKASLEKNLPGLKENKHV